MLLKVLMDFRSLKIRDKAHAPTHIHKQKRKLTTIVIIITPRPGNTGLTSGGG